MFATLKSTKSFVYFENQIFIFFKKSHSEHDVSLYQSELKKKRKSLKQISSQVFIIDLHRSTPTCPYFPALPPPTSRPYLPLLPGPTSPYFPALPPPTSWPHLPLLPGPSSPYFLALPAPYSLPYLTLLPGRTYLYFPGLPAPYSRPYLPYVILSEKINFKFIISIINGLLGSCIYH